MSSSDSDRPRVEEKELELSKVTNFYETKRPGLHMLRCTSGLIALVAIFIALRELPLATVVSISFAAPIFTTILSIFLLSEKVGIFRWLAVLVGFIGILVITEPGISELNIYYIFPIIFCLGLSYVAITIRQLSTTEPVWLISFYFSLSITLLSFLTIPQGWVMPSFNHLILLTLIGVFGGVANLWLSQSYKFSEVSLVTPLKYLALVFAIIFFPRHSFFKFPLRQNHALSHSFPQLLPFVIGLYFNLFFSEKVVMVNHFSVIWHIW